MYWCELRMSRATASGSTRGRNPRAGAESATPYWDQARVPGGGGEVERGLEPLGAVVEAAGADAEQAQAAGGVGFEVGVAVAAGRVERLVEARLCGGAIPSEHCAGAATEPDVGAQRVEAVGQGVGLGEVGLGAAKAVRRSGGHATRVRRYDARTQVCQIEWPVASRSFEERERIGVAPTGTEDLGAKDLEAPSP